MFNPRSYVAEDFRKTSGEIAGAGFVQVFGICAGADQRLQLGAQFVFDEMDERLHVSRSLTDTSVSVFRDVDGHLRGRELQNYIVDAYTGVAVLIDRVVENTDGSIAGQTNPEQSDSAVANVTTAYVGHRTPSHWVMRHFEAVSESDEPVNLGIDSVVKLLLKRCGIEISAETTWIAVVERGIDVEKIRPSFNHILYV